MSASGEIIICKRADFEAANPGCDPAWLRLYAGEVLGVPALWGYEGNNLDDATYRDDRYFDFLAGPVLITDERREATSDEIANMRNAALWFDRNAERHEVWT